MSDVGSFKIGWYSDDGYHVSITPVRDQPELTALSVGCDRTKPSDILSENLCDLSALSCEVLVALRCKRMNMNELTMHGLLPLSKKSRMLYLLVLLKHGTAVRLKQIS